MIRAKTLLGRRHAAWHRALDAAYGEAGMEVDLSPDHDPADTDILILAPSEAPADFTPYDRARAVLGIWAGVETITANDTLRIPLARMVDPGLTRGMVEYVAGHVLRHHLNIDAMRDRPSWDHEVPRLAPDRRVGILGAGELGAAAARALAGLGFDVAAWSRSPKEIGARHLHGPAGFEEILERSDILVALLPLTPETEGLLGAAAFARMPRGAILINPGRGGLVDEDALLAALDRGQIAHATLDTFRIEPLPEAHVFWTHPGVTVTPHIASETRLGTAARVIAENTRRALSGEPLIGAVDRAAGY